MCLRVVPYDSITKCKPKSSVGAREHPLSFGGGLAGYGILSGEFSGETRFENISRDLQVLGEFIENLE